MSHERVNRMNEIVEAQERHDVATAASQAGSAQALIDVIRRAASDPAIDVTKVERLMEMYERVAAKQAEAQFNAAMSATQAEMGRVSVDAHNPQTRSRYATYAAIDRALRPIYTSHGFSLSFDTGKEAPDGFVRVTAYVSHSGGHTREYGAQMPADGKGAKGGDVMTKTHAFGAATSYGMRYLLKQIFNVAIGEDDTDGNTSNGVADAWIAIIKQCLTTKALDDTATALGQEIERENSPITKPIAAQIRRAWSERRKVLKAGVAQ